MPLEQISETDIVSSSVLGPHLSIPQLWRGSDVSSGEVMILLQWQRSKLCIWGQQAHSDTGAATSRVGIRTQIKVGCSWLHLRRTECLIGHLLHTAGESMKKPSLTTDLASTTRTPRMCEVWGVLQNQGKISSQLLFHLREILSQSVCLITRYECHKLN